ncbi:thymus-specific serine protease-like isoform X5 [Salvelinus fontinalis]|uniref:thymus-specific serine protease-like isoform X5 n=1 Tax=Salvelinus fontinalis TaxID=8038 RepID=UPI0024853B04|nr:thymus-specific serine protease-like isoform X5 [Salvelinus fontinalis]
MLLSPSRCIILLLLVNSVYSGRVLRKIKERVRKIQYEKAKKNVLMSAVNGHKPICEVRDGKIHQPLDHFDSQNDETFPQRFLVNEAYWERPHGPVFLFIGGEGPISEFDVLAGHHVDMAEEHGALLVALEHRFYGESINKDGLETENLGDLSSQQALADIAEFHQYISDRFDLSDKNTWISFGGSYAGALSAWLRGKFPHLVYGAVASSAPVKAKLDFSAFNKVVGLSLTDEDVGGSDKCVGDISEAFAAVEAALFAGNATEVGKDFGCCETPEDLEDQIELMQSLADIVMGTVAYNEEGGILTIEELCDIMTNETETFDSETEAYNRLIKLVQIDRATGEEPCLDASHKQTIKDLSDTNLDSAYNGERQWYYQTCTEFGFFQTCEDASCPFSRMLTLQAQTDLCPEVFNIPQHSLPGHIAFTNKYYGGDHPDTDRVLYVNGDIDPWHELSVLEEDLDKEDEDMTILIEGTAHCADMNPDGVTDRPALKQARKAIERKVAKWLKEAARKLMD